MRSNFSADNLKHFLFRDGIPVTKIIILINVVSLLVAVLFRANALMPLEYSYPGSLIKPWTLITYPLVCDGDLISLIFAGYWLWVAGGTLERRWGSSKFAIYFFAIAAISAIGLLIGSVVTGASTLAAGLWIPLAGITVAFAMLDPEQTILFAFIIPLRLKYLAIISAAMIFLNFAQHHNFLLGLFSLLGCAASYLYVRYEDVINFHSYGHKDDNNIIRIHPKYSVKRSMNPIKWYRDKQEQKRLRDLFKRSGLDD